MIDDLIAVNVRAAGKQRWCDKSLSNVAGLEQLALTWPEAKFILLHRHAMDVIASALEASEWGLDTFGLGAYAQMSPNNSIMAVAGYWIERTAGMLAFEARHPDRCLRLRYEDLVTRTDASMGAVWQLCGVDGGRAGSDAFSSDHDPLAPADYKIWHTSAVHAESVGRGSRLPTDRLGVPVRETMNQLLVSLGYEMVDERWGSGSDSRLQPWFPSAAEVRVLDGHRVLARAMFGDAGPAATGDTGERSVVVVERAALDALCRGSENFGSALRRRGVRRYGAVPSTYDNEKAFLDAVAAYLTTAGWDLLARAEVLEAAGIRRRVARRRAAPKGGRSDGR